LKISRLLQRSEMHIVPKRPLDLGKEIDISKPLKGMTLLYIHIKKKQTSIMREYILSLYKGK
jgi:hypothetical protein